VLGREVVVKRCRPRRPDESVAAYARRVQLFKREAQLTAQLEHPGIVPVHDVGQGPHGEPSFTMKRLEGERLGEVIQRRRAGAKLDLPALVEILLRVADAVGYAHSRGIVHRDLKPDNIILDANGVPHVVDFGLAKLRGGEADGPGAGPGLTRSNATMGTVHYMAPEQVASAKAVDHRADIYALGVVIYELLTGELPLGRFESPSQRVKVDVRIDDVVLKALARDPELRWQRMSQIGQAVAQVGTTAKPMIFWKVVYRIGAYSFGGYVTLGINMLFNPHSITVWKMVSVAILAIPVCGWILISLLFEGHRNLPWRKALVLIALVIEAFLLILTIKYMAHDLHNPWAA
jgi:serine/threonine protein kinase